jgi:hypothetical protein
MVAHGQGIKILLGHRTSRWQRAAPQTAKLAVRLSRAIPSACGHRPGDTHPRHGRENQRHRGRDGKHGDEIVEVHRGHHPLPLGHMAEPAA